jgi:hypothetical protein
MSFGMKGLSLLQSSQKTKGPDLARGIHDVSRAYSVCAWKIVGGEMIGLPEVKTAVCRKSLQEGLTRMV